MPSMTDYFTREAANAGIKCPLTLPDGTDTGDWLHILGVDSDYFRKKEAWAQRRLMQHATIEDDDKRAEAVENDRLVVLASLVSSWSFDEECTEANKVKLFKEAPKLAELVDLKAAQRAAFFIKSSKLSTNGQKAKPSSTRRQRAPKQA